MATFTSPHSTTVKPLQATRVLIVEDDRTMEALWRYIVETAAPGAEVEWVTSGEAASVEMKDEFDLVIADIFLGGQTTGLDLWAQRHSDSQSAFILMSVLTPARLSILAQGSAKPLPSYLQKPLDPSQCIETVRALLRAQQVRC